MSIHLYTPILITRSFLQHLTWKYIIHHLIFVMPGSSKMQILILVDEQLKCLIVTAFVNTSVNEKVFILNKTILNILSNFIPHETWVDDKDPPWFTKKIKKISIKRKTMFINVIEIVKPATYITWGDWKLYKKTWRCFKTSKICRMEIDRVSLIKNWQKHLHLPFRW